MREPFAKAFGNLRIQERQESVSPVDEGHLYSKRRKYRRVFTSNYTTAHDCKASGDRIHLQNRVRVKNHFVIERNFGGAVRRGTRRNENYIAAQTQLFISGNLDGKRIGIFK